MYVGHYDISLGETRSTQHPVTEKFTDETTCMNNIKIQEIS